MDRDPDLVKSRGYVYQCGRCPFRGEKNRVTDHFYKYHVPLEMCNYYCTLCLFRCQTEYELRSHVRGYSKHIREVEALKRSGSARDERIYLKKSESPFLFIDGRDIVKQSYEESNTYWKSRSGTRVHKPRIRTPSVTTATTPVSIATRPLTVTSHDYATQPTFPSFTTPLFPATTVSLIPPSVSAITCTSYNYY